MSEIVLDWGSTVSDKNKTREHELNQRKDNFRKRIELRCYKDVVIETICADYVEDEESLIFSVESCKNTKELRDAIKDVANNINGLWSEIVAQTEEAILREIDKKFNAETKN
jgi:hypothetical protein